MSSAARHLRVIDADGVELEGCPECARKDHTIAGLQTNIAGWTIKYGELKADKEKQALESPYWSVGIEHFNLWRDLCNHPRSEWTADRFYLALPFLKSKKYGPLVPRAIEGIAFDPFVTTRKNGTKKRHDGWHLLFKGTDAFEEYVNKAPRSEVAA